MVLITAREGGWSYLLWREKNRVTFDNLLLGMTKKRVILLYFTLVFLCIFFCDRALVNLIYQFDFRSHIPLLSIVTRLGLSIFYFPTLIGLILFFRFIHVNHTWEARFLFLFLCISIPATICTLLKFVLGRARPNLFLYDHIFGFYGFTWDAHYWSCPSGHTTTIFSVMLGLAILFPRYLVGFFLTGFIVALTRVLLTHHYLSDVLISFYLVLVELGILLYVLRKKAWLMPAYSNREKLNVSSCSK